MERGNSLLRFFDETLGPMLVRVLSWFRRRRTRPSQLNRIGLIKTAAIGDTILLSAIIDDLRNAYPRAEITLFTGASNSGFAKLLRNLDGIVQLPLRNPFKARHLLRARDLELCIDADSWPRISALLCSLSGSFTVGFETAGQNRHSLFDQTVKHDSSIHELENYRNLLRALRVPVGSPPQNLSGTWSPLAQQIVFHLWPGGTRSHLREWSAENWLLLSNELLRDPSVTIKLTGGKEDVSRNEDFLAKVTHRARFENVAGQPFAKTLEIIRSAKLVVSVNTGIMHLAAVSGTPTIGLHGPTNPNRWGPIGERSVSILSETAGAGFLNLGFEYDGQPEVMQGISFETVSDEAKRLLALSPP